MRGDLSSTLLWRVPVLHARLRRGFFHCLSKDGEVLDAEKQEWLQARQVWMYTELYRKTDRFKTEEILQAAIRGITT